jgi:hypothetical protein
LNDVVSVKKWTYTIIENEVLENVELDIYEKMTYVILCKFANKQSSKAFPSVKTLSTMVGASDRKVSQVLKSLVEKQYISIEFRNQKTSIYTLLELPFIQNEVRVEGAGDSGRVVQEIRVGGAPGSDELQSLNNNQSNNIKDISDKSLVSQFDEWWKVYNKKKDKPKTLIAFKRIIKKYGYETLMNKTRLYISGFDSDDTYKKYPTSFLNSFDPDNDYSPQKKGGQSYGFSSNQQASQRASNFPSDMEF